MDTNISNGGTRVNGVVLSQVPHPRHQTQLSRQATLQIVPVHPAGPQPQPPPLSDTWTRISQMRGNACRRVRCSHNAVIDVSNPSSVGSVPVKPRKSKSLSPNPTSHHVNNPGVHEPTTKSHSRFASALRGKMCPRSRIQNTSREGEGDAQVGAAGRAGQAVLVLAVILQRHSVYKMQKRIVKEHQC